eukprot:CAMPEP_0195038606 /NCGR_PEP_ID=MMETSP0326_2-20130528/77795_1 /TAXON_ID=2866 ORGANISM="Crypthecodinium cohnii, Strain Seligo" /NCGR_SAMPLE_ID=MMETSP0326_2 /ASSEMBLY_ACC=CAM_ASM_000348 /LENGTH=97 /DNA_ID=CAMNT_0040065121 /DNA_START=63 /DNA_END=353 /DNA_ORIENTATION=+
MRSQAALRGVAPEAAVVVVPLFRSQQAVVQSRCRCLHVGVFLEAVQAAEAADKPPQVPIWKMSLGLAVVRGSPQHPASLVRISQEAAVQCQMDPNSW